MPVTFLRRLSRFSLRGLLIGMTVACVGMGIWSVYVLPFRNQNLALGQLRAQCADWLVEPANGPPWQKWLVEKMLGERRFTYVVGLNLNKCQATEEQIAAVANFPWLRTLQLDRSSVTEDDAAILANLHELETLSLTYTKISDRGLRRLTAAEKLSELYLTGVPITDESLPTLKLLKQLERLFIRWTQLTPDGAEQLRDALPGCEVVYHELRSKRADEGKFSLNSP